MAIGISPWDRRDSKFHGSLRGADSPRQSDTFQGRFGRMFRALPAAQFSDEDLIALAQGADGMEAEAETATIGGKVLPSATPESDTGFVPVPNAPDDEENFGIPAGYTYLGQFIDHDITFDPMSSLMKDNDPESLIDFRTPALDLDNIYGRGPADQPYMYTTEKGVRANVFVMGRPLTANGTPTAALDLARVGERAVIGDKRNDENVIVSQLQGVFLQFHNAMARANPTFSFAEVQRLVRWHYQFVVVNDFLPRIVGFKTMLAIMPKHKKSEIQDVAPKLLFYRWRETPFMPVEFAAAAYRFGHSMVRPIYRLSTQLAEQGDPTGVAGRRFIFAAVKNSGLNGFHTFDSRWAIDWRLFFPLGGRKPDPDDLTMGRLQPAYKIDTSLVNPLAFLPEFSVPEGAEGDLKQDDKGKPVPVDAKDDPPSLALRNLLRGRAMGLPSGEAVAMAMGLDPLHPSEVRIGKATVEKTFGTTGANKTAADISSNFSGNTPLWVYVLAEAQNDWAKEAAKIKGTDAAAVKKKNSIHVHLGAVGGRIVAEVLVGLIHGDPNSYLAQAPFWTPDERDGGAAFGMANLIEMSGVASTPA